MSQMSILTCKNHPNLRWSTKTIAITDGRYNGSRSIFFGGEPTTHGMYQDGSGLDCSTYFNNNGNPRVIFECDCPARELILAPEDAMVKR